MKHPTKDGTISVPFLGSEEVKKGVLNAILKQAKIETKKGWKAKNKHRSDQSNNWSILTGINAEDLVNLNYKSINNRVVDYSKGQLLEIEISANKYVISELKNEGLGLADITSVSLTSDNFVIVTSQCNTFSQECGAFYKPLADFLERTELNQKLVY